MKVRIVNSPLSALLANCLAIGKYSLAVKKFDADRADFGQTQLVDKLDDLGQRRFDDRPAGAGDREAEQGALPQVLIAALSDGNIESMRHPRLDSFDDSPFALERMIFGNHQVELENTDNHGENGNRKVAPTT